MKLFVLLAVMMAGLLAGCATRESASPEPETPRDNTRSAYSQPLSTPGSRFASLPQPVRNTVLAEAGMAEITDVKKESKEGRMIYTVYFRDPRVFPPLIVGADGSVLHPDLTVAVAAPQQSASVSVNDLPVSVSKVLKEKSSDGEVSSIDKETWGDHTVYIVSFKNDAHHPKLYIVADGTILVPAK